MKSLKNKTYPIRINDIVLESAMEYCNDNGLILSEEVRELIEKFDLLNRKNKKNNNSKVTIVTEAKEWRALALNDMEWEDINSYSDGWEACHLHTSLRDNLLILLEVYIFILLVYKYNKKNLNTYG